MESALSRVCPTPLESLEPVLKSEFQQVCLAVKHEVNRAVELISNSRNEIRKVRVTHAQSDKFSPANGEVNTSAIGQPVSLSVSLAVSQSVSQSVC